MRPEWFLVVISGLALAGSALWTVINLRIENRLLARIEELKDWCDSRYLRRPDPGFSAISERLRANS